MSIPLGARLRDATRTLHAEVERSGLMRQLLRGPLRQADYVALLRNLHALYSALEQALAQHAAHPRLAPLALPALARCAPLAQDLHHLHGADWPALPLVPAARQYAQHLQALAGQQPLALAAHAYVRYLGDLHGGQVLRRVVAERLALAPGEAVHFYTFGPDDAVARLILQLRSALDQVADTEAQAAALVQEACSGFHRHRQMFEQLAAPAAR